ncbi:conserved exported protein of unknown function [Candidatus Filomicrobium marinum]|uniref:Uncharacterized protein n=2 Tax=Filomicrobium TaxID=119044 RepID=A0A0D6JGR4_9HYPH|nr:MULTISPECIES: hypothetical protein [Filomicrobium]MCV0369689.1 hypothetical protein [Filomicrobium sp.]CFX47964.1 conserved exported protein of unknown function [Candidatus Filomicrobium marinum]CPR20478.1 conserved exported protein of unknown function [Candidatus Filomicrobium marinum]SDP15651.1 hypothetical protein SAMN04488061_2345 [Filomicrobium insigne]
MSLRAFLALALAVCVTGVFSTSHVMADDTGLASIHDWRKVGRKTCFTEHKHYGSSAGHSSKKAAQRAAISDWQGFTAFEYGTDWAYYKYAISKSGGCSQGSGGWKCEVEAIPCRPR